MPRRRGTQFTTATAELSAGHGWRLFAMLDPEAADGKAEWRVTVGRTDAWPFPSEAGKAVDGADLMRGVLERVTSNAAKAADVIDAHNARARELRIARFGFDPMQASKASADAAPNHADALRIALDRSMNIMIEFAREELERLNKLRPTA